MSARLVFDVLTVMIARPNAEVATLITSDVDERDRPLITGERTKGGFYLAKNGIELCIARAKIYAPLVDLIWMETDTTVPQTCIEILRVGQGFLPGPDTGLLVRYRAIVSNTLTTAISPSSRRIFLQWDSNSILLRWPASMH